MSRSVWKGPFVDPSLIKKVDKLKDKSLAEQERLKKISIEVKKLGAVDLKF